jgi:hypothetical protein
MRVGGGGKEPGRKRELLQVNRMWAVRKKKQKTIKLVGCVGLGVVARAKCEGGWFGYSILFGTQGTV